MENKFLSIYLIEPTLIPSESNPILRNSGEPGERRLLRGTGRGVRRRRDHRQRRRQIRVSRLRRVLHAIVSLMDEQSKRSDSRVYNIRSPSFRRHGWPRVVVEKVPRHLSANVLGLVGTLAVRPRSGGRRGKAFTSAILRRLELLFSFSVLHSNHRCFKDEKCDIIVFCSTNKIKDHLLLLNDLCRVL